MGSIVRNVYSDANVDFPLLGPSVTRLDLTGAGSNIPKVQMAEISPPPCDGAM